MTVTTRTSASASGYDPNTYSQLCLLGQTTDANQLQVHVEAHTCGQERQGMVGKKEMLALQWNMNPCVEVACVLLGVLSVVGLVVVLVVGLRA